MLLGNQELTKTSVKRRIGYVHQEVRLLKKKKKKKLHVLLVSKLHTYLIYSMNFTIMTLNLINYMLPVHYHDVKPH